MNKQTSGAALLTAVLLLGWSGVASAYSGGVFDPKATRCNACHTGGPAPTASFSTATDGMRLGAGFRIRAGQQATLMLMVTAQPGKGLGLAITAADGLRLEGTTANVRVERQVFGHQAVLNEPTGRFVIPFNVTASPASCGRSLTLSANVTTVDKNRSPSGDGTATSATSVLVDCPDAAKSESAAAESPRAVVPTLKPAIVPTAPALPATAAGAARVMAPTGQITAQVRVAVDALRAPGGVAQLELSNVERLDASSRPAEAHFLSAGGGDSGSATIYFTQAAGHILIDCTVRSPGDVRFTIDAGSLHIENTVPASDGHAVTVVPRSGIRRDVQVTLRSTGRKWSLSSCDLVPVR
jgi:hypothetical protein